MCSCGMEDAAQVGVCVLVVWRMQPRLMCSCGMEDAAQVDVCVLVVWRMQARL